MTVRVVTAPTGAIVSLETLREQLSIEDDEFADILPGHLAAATTALQSATQRRFLTQVLEWVLPCWPDCFRLPVAPVAAGAVVSIKYTDVSGAEQTLSPSAYVVSPDGPTVSIRPAFGTRFPAIGRDAVEGVVVRFTAGEAPEALDADVVLAAQMLTALYFTDRGDDPTPRDLAASGLPRQVENLIAAQRWD